MEYLDPRNLLEEALAISISSVSSLTNVVQYGGTVTLRKLEAQL